MSGTALVMGTNSSVMASMQRAETGAPAWVDLHTTAGTADAARFYCTLFGWTVVARHRPIDEDAGYWVFQHGDVAVGGLATDADASWTMYVRVADVRATALAVAARGGTVVAAPVRTLDGGRLALCADPEGARFAVWESPEGEDETDPGRAVAVSSPSAPGYQLLCRDAGAAAEFYGAVLGWDTEVVPCAEGARCARFLHPDTGRVVGMAVEAGPDAGTATRPGTPGRLAARWTVHLTVTDTDQAVARAAELGATVSVAPFNLPDVGRVAILDDPDHATFSIVQAA